MTLDSITNLVTTIVALLTIPSLLYAIFRSLRKIMKAQIDNKQEDDLFKRDTYRNRIIRFHNDLKMNPDTVYPEHMFEAAFSDYDKYKKLNGNTYVDSVVDDIRNIFENQHGRRF